MVLLKDKKLTRKELMEKCKENRTFMEYYSSKKYYM